MQISIRKTKTFALIDTGASISCVSQSFISKTDFSNSKLESPDFLFIKGVSGQKLKVLGKLVLPISFSGHVYEFSVHVIKDLHHSFILGVDLMETTKLLLILLLKPCLLTMTMLNLLSAQWKQMLGMLGLQNSSKFHQIQKLCLKLKLAEKQMIYCF